MKQYLIVTKQGFTAKVYADTILEACKLSGYQSSVIVLATIIIDTEESIQLHNIETPETEM